jgi:hypothetical protein
MATDVFELPAPSVNSIVGHLFELGQDPLGFLSRCRGFALMEAALLLATIAQRFQIDLVPGYPIVPQPSITLRPETGLKVQLKQIALDASK